jgi:predicted nuclease of predicted toxin-antitoxin system
VRFLLDGNLSPRLAEALTEAGYQVRHVVDLGLLGASDAVIFDRAAGDGDVVITAGVDFSMLLALQHDAGPSVVLLRHQVAELTWEVHLRLLTANLPAVTGDLEAGAVVSMSPTRLAVRRLPIS